MTQRKLTLPSGTFKAYLFDCHGKIADSMPLHYTAWKRALGEWGCDFPESTFYAWGGRTVVEIIRSLNEQHGLEMAVEEVAVRKEAYYYEILPELEVVPDVWRTSMRSTAGFLSLSSPEAPAKA